MDTAGINLDLGKIENPVLKVSEIYLIGQETIEYARQQLDWNERAHEFMPEYQPSPLSTNVDKKEYYEAEHHVTSSQEHQRCLNWQ